MIPTILANTASALFHAYLSLTLLHVEAMAELIGAGAPIIWTIGSILMVARLTLHLLPVLFRCVVSPITRCICAVTILTCVATMLLKAYLTFVIFYLAAVSEICNAFGPMWSIGSLVLLERMWRFITLLPALLRSVVFAGRRIITAAVEALISVACDSILPAAYWFLNVSIHVRSILLSHPRPCLRIACLAGLRSIAAGHEKATLICITRSPGRVAVGRRAASSSAPEMSCLHHIEAFAFSPQPYVAF